MKISTKVRYGLKALVYIAEESAKDRIVRIKEISEKEGYISTVSGADTL